MIIASGGVCSAVSMSLTEVGEPVVKVRLGWTVDGEERARAVMVWDLERRDLRMREPLRPVAPRRRTCILRVWFGGYVLIEEYRISLCK